MSHKDGTMEFYFSEGGRPLRYSKNGQFQECSFIEFHEYTGKHKKQYFKLRKMIAQLFLELPKVAERLKSISGRSGEAEASNVAVPFAKKSEEDHQSESEDLEGMVSFALETCADIDTEEFVNVFAAMVCNPDKPLGMLDGEVKMRTEHFDEMHPDDQLSAAVKYCCFFGIGLIGDMKSGSNTSMIQHSQVKVL